MLFSWIKQLNRRTKRKGFTGLDYLLAAYANPSLLRHAVRHLSQLNSRRVEGAFRASQNAALREDPSLVPVAIDTLLDGLSAHLGVLVLERGRLSMSIGVADINLISALVYLTSQVPGTKMSLGNAQFNFGMKYAKRRVTEARKVTATVLDENMTSFDIHIEGYQKHAPARWISTNSANELLRGLYSDLLEQPGLYDARDILQADTLQLTSDQKPVDAVYTWVDHNDPEWQAMFQIHQEENARANAAAAQMSPDSDAETRFHNNEELRYSLRSVEQNLPWIRKIFIFTNCARPPWLRVDDERLVWVQHDAVIPDKYLPTFNSHVIETYLQHLPDLSERFIYLNDDFFIGEPLRKSYFFNEGGQSRAMLEPYGMVSGPVKVGDADYLNAARNCANLLRSELGFVPTQLHKHTPYALQRSVLLEIEERFDAAFSAMRGNKFRKPNDINLTSFLYHHYALATGRAVQATTQNGFVKSHDIRWRDKLKKAGSGCEIICINEGSEHAPSRDWHEKIREFLERKYPDPSSWE